MSIYPKNINKRENLIIHLRFSNKGSKPQKVTYKLSINSPDKKEIFYKEEDILLGTDKTEYVKQLYHSIYISNRFKPGKYIVDFHMICNGHIIESLTKDNDYFYVEDLKYYISKNNTIVVNKSNEKTNFKLYKGGKSEEHIIDGKQKLKFSEKYDFIEYANNRFDLIKEK